MMDNKYLQGLTQEQINKMVSNLGGSPEGLVISAYMDEQKRWQAKLSELLYQKTYYETILDDYTKKLDDLSWSMETLSAEIENESGFKKFLRKIFKLKSVKAKKLASNKKTYDGILDKYLVINGQAQAVNEKYVSEYDNAPNVDRYELALFGNKLFKAK